MLKSTKWLLWMYGILVLFKVAMGFLINSPTMFGDEFWYSQMARSFLKYGKFLIWGYTSDEYMPLYPMILSLAYIFKDTSKIYLAMKIINALISSLVIIPVYLINSEFMNRKKALLITMVIAVMPVLLTFSPYILTENLFPTLFLFAVYFTYKSFTNINMKWDFLAGLFIGLSFLTKIPGALLIIPAIILFLISIFKKQWVQVKNKLVLFFIALLTVLPWLIRNVKLYGFNLLGLVGPGDIIGVRNMRDYAQQMNTNFNILSFLDWFGLNMSLLILATGIVLFLFAVNAYFNKKNDNLKIFSIIVIFSTLCFIILTTYFNINDRPFERYFSSILPLIVILGFISIKEFKINNKRALQLIIPTSLFLALYYKLFTFPLFPSNNSSLSHFGAISYVAIRFLEDYSTPLFIILSLSLPFLFFLFQKYKNFKKITAVFFTYFLLISLLSVGIMYYNSQAWNELDQMKLGKWIDENLPETSVVLFDKQDKDVFIGVNNSKYELISKPRVVRVGAFWINSELRYGNIDDFKYADYIISTQDLKLEEIKRFGDIKIYKVV